MKQQVRRLLLAAIGRTVRRGQPSGSSDPRNVLVLRPDHLGDLLLSVPALRWLRWRLPKSTITLLVGPWNQETAAHIPYVDQVLTLSYPWFDRQPKGAPWKPYQQLREVASTLRVHQWDMAVILRHDFWWGAWLAAAAGIPHRVGYNLPEVAPFLTHPVPFDPGPHEVDQCLRLVQNALPRGDADFTAAPAPELEFALTPEERAYAHRWFQERQVSRPLIALHPGAGAPVKLWRPERFGTLAQRLANDYGAQVVLTGDASETALVESVVQRGGEPVPFTLVGASIGQVAAVLQRCRLVIGGDAGIMHLAAAVGTPTVRLYGPVDPYRFGPWGPPERHLVVQAALPCVPCNRLDFPTEELAFHPCVRSITTNAVLQAAAPLLTPVAAVS